MPCAQEKAFDTYGPPAGVDTVDAVCDQPVLVPPSDAVADDAGPDSASATVFVSANEPPPETLPL